MQTSQRDSYFDFLRGLAIIFVVGIHTVGSGFDYYSATGFLTVLVRQIIGCAVPIFLAISGFFLVKKNMKTMKEYTSFLKKQIPIVYFPCLFWSLPYLLISIKSGNSIFYSFLLLFICGFSVYYFVACIIQCYILLPIIKTRNFLFTILMLITSLLWAFLHVKYNLIPNAKIPLVIYAAPFPNLLVFFSLGCWLGCKERTYSLSLMIFLLILSLGLSVYETNFLHDTFEISGLGMKPSIHIFDFLSILVLFHQKTKKLYKENWVTKKICDLGIDSFTIYLIHLLVAIVLFRIPMINQFWLSKWFILLFTSWMFVKVMKSFLSNKVWKFLGLR